MGVRLNMHLAPVRLQFAQTRAGSDSVASQRIFFLRHSSHARETFDRFGRGPLGLSLIHI